MNLKILSTRAKGEFPLSIGTSIALESFFGLVKDDEKPKDVPPYKKYDCLSINLSTLVRNMINSVKSNELKELTRNDFAIVLRNEIDIIVQLFEQFAGNRTIVNFYYNHYHGVDKILKGGLFKTKMTDNQMLIQLLERDVPRLISFSGIDAFEETNLMITHGRRNNLLFTHNPLDLIFNSLSSIALLESHTGKVKLPAQFNSKLKSAPDIIPFNKITLQVYGDKAGNILPMPSKVRTLFSEEAKNLGINSAMDLKRFVSRMRESKVSEIKSLVSKLK